MRRLIQKTEVSLDGYLEGPGGSMDWFATGSGKEWTVLFRMLSTVDTVIMGRGMYAGYASYWKSVLAAPKKHPREHVRYARWADKTPHIVFSKKMRSVDWACATLNRGELGAEVRKLKRAKGGDIMVYGGAALISALTERGLIDEYNLMVNPVILGGGKLIFRDVARRRRLRLLSARPMDAGVMWLRYADEKKR